LFVVSLTYIAPLDAVDAAIPEHIAFLDRHYAAGTFLASGRKEPRTGGIILAVAPNRAALQAILAEDPFAKLNLANYVIEEFIPSRVRAGLEALLPGN
jgi:uncharacterized protein YciI